MALRGVKPKAVQKRLKAMFFGQAGVGKTTAAIQFPKPYLIDTERGAENPQYVQALDKAGGAYFFTTDFDEMCKEVTSLLSEGHQYRTVIIDPFSVVYSDLCDRAAKSLATKEDPEGTAWGRHIAKADGQVKRLLNLLLRLDMNVIITCHAKGKWDRDSGKQVGETFDGYKKLDYLFDLVFEVRKVGKERKGVVVKSRIESFTDGEFFPFSYKEIADRYGHAELERDAVAQQLADPEQVKRAISLVEVLKIDETTVGKWFDKAQATCWEEMPADAISKCIDFMAAKVAA